MSLSPREAAFKALHELQLRQLRPKESSSQTPKLGSGRSRSRPQELRLAQELRGALELGALWDHMGALIIGIGFLAPFYYIYTKEPQKSHR